MNKIVSHFCNLTLKPLMLFALVKETRGLENIPKTNFILVSNHQSHLDWLICGYLCTPRRFHFIGQVDKYKGVMRVLRDVLYFISGTIRLDRTSAESKKEAVGQAIDFLKKGDIVILYPEGTRSLTGEIQQGKWGTAKFFLETGVPILPINCSGTFELLPPHGKMKIKKLVKVNIGKPLYFKEEFDRAENMDKNSEEYKQIVRNITVSMMEKISNLKKEVPV